MSPEDSAILARHLEPVNLNAKDVLVEPHQPIEYVYFIEQGICSMIATSECGQRIEIGNIGREGMEGVSVVLEMESAPHLTFVQAPGSALRIRTEDFRRLLETSASLRKLLLRFAHTLMTQVGQTALADGRYTLERRLARWILMCHDRLDTDEIPLTHQFLALMLGVRRSGVTTATHILEGERMIKANRGQLIVVNRAKLVEFAGGCYGVPEAEYLRAIGLPIASKACSVSS